MLHGYTDIPCNEQNVKITMPNKISVELNLKYCYAKHVENNPIPEDVMSFTGVYWPYF